MSPRSMTSAEKIYDAVMRLPIVAYQMFLISRELSAIRGLIAFHPYFGGDWPFLMTVFARVAGVIFIAAILLLSISRFRPVGIGRAVGRHFDGNDPGRNHTGDSGGAGSGPFDEHHARSEEAGDGRSVCAHQ